MVQLKVWAEILTVQAQFKFQFLHGTIKSNLNFVGANVTVTFQFLHGTIKSARQEIVDKTEQLFQFLDVTIKRFY